MKNIYKIKKWDRRNFIKRIVFLILGIEFSYVIYNILGIKNNKKIEDNFFNAGKISSFEKGKLYPFSSGKFYLSVFEDGGILAISVKCTHLGCAVQHNTKNKGFECPCHASSFNEYGEVQSPPATRALDIFPVVVDKGVVYIDTTSPIKRTNFNKSQLVYA